MWIVVEGPPSPAGSVMICIRVGLNTVCESENVFMMSIKAMCSWRLFVWGIDIVCRQTNKARCDNIDKK